jgi:iron complex transport system ATP-binding protein
MFPMDETVLQMQDIHFRRGDAHILRGVDWQVCRGQHWAVLGPNGSGKTTLMMIATGYLPSSRGRVYLIEGHISEIVLPEVRKRIGVVSNALSDAMLKRHDRTTGLKIALSGRQASLGLYQPPTGRDIAEARAALDELGAGHLADKPYRTMSTGERQICMVARCHMARADLVILDEPCVGLDVAAREAVLGVLDRACAAPDAPPHVLVTHHAEEVVPGITHVLLLGQGRAVACGVREHVLSEAHLSAAFGLPLRVERNAGRTWVRPFAGQV